MFYLFYVCLYNDNKSVIELLWEKGENIWKNDNFIIIPRENFEINHLPIHCILIPNKIPGSSTNIKNNISNSNDLLPEVKKYILDNKIY